MDIEIAKYKKGDLLNVPGCSTDTISLEDIFLNGDSFTGRAPDGWIAFCCGVAFYWPGHGEIWVVMGQPANRCIGSFSKFRDLLGWVVVKHNLFRTTAHCNASWGEANRTLQHLKFKLEAELPSYGPNRETYNLYGKVWP